MAEIRVTDRTGGERTISSDNGRPLMEALRDANIDLQGTCGGAMSCGTCHVHVIGYLMSAVAPGLSPWNWPSERNASTPLTAPRP